MTTAAGRIAATVRADFVIRFRRASTAVVFLILSSFAYMWIPDPSTGRALLQIDGRRALLNSAAIGMATATLAAIFIGLFGFYVISNAIRTDVASRCGFVIASTSVRRTEYVFGKFLGNFVFLAVFTGGFMVTSMAMLLVRGEARLEPLVFISQYLLIVPSALIFVSAAAILFESVPFLSGRFGDVAYFFFWVFSLSLAAMASKTASFSIANVFDVSGLGYLFSAMKGLGHSDSVSIGASTFDATKPPYVFDGLPISFGVLAMRLVSLAGPAALIVLAAVFFHRFDPARVRVSGPKGHTGWIARFNALVKPIARLLYAITSTRSSSTSLVRAALEDARLTLAAFPLFVLAVIGVAIASLAAPTQSLTEGVLPVIFVVAAVVIADIASRERRSGTSALVFSTPHVRQQFVLWKFLAAAIVSLFLFGLPIARVAMSRPSIVPALVTGVFFVVALATFLATVSGTPKTFLIVFLSFWYVAMNDKGVSPGLDYAGLHGIATPQTVATYAAVGIVSLIAAHLWHLRRLA